MPWDPKRTAVEYTEETQSVQRMYKVLSGKTWRGPGESSDSIWRIKNSKNVGEFSWYPAEARKYLKTWVE